MGVLESLASFANATYPDGINWAEQIQRYGSREGSVQFYLAQKDDAGGYYSDLVSARGNCILLLADIGIAPRMKLAEYQAGKLDAQSTIDTNRSMLEEALSSGLMVLPKPIIFDAIKLRDLIQGHVALLNSAMALHQTKMIFKLGWTDTQIADHAQMLARSWNQLKYLLVSGVLSNLKLAPVSGLGDGGVSVGIIIIALGAIAIVAAAIVYSVYLLLSLSAAERVCKALIEAKDPNASAMCAKIVPQAPPGPADILQSVILYGAIGLGVYALINYMPYITGQVAASRRRLT